ncbi:hypothetical protein IAU59_003625 [Kwoniella sp. CBS 9459]
MKRCRFIDTPQGCKRGSSCTYSHTPTSTPYTAKSSSSGSAAPTRSHVIPPNGQCKIFYNEGTCARGSDCKYQHRLTLVKNETGRTPPKISAPEQIRNLATRIADFNSDSLRGDIEPDWRSGPFKRLVDRLTKGDDLKDPADVYTFVGGLVATTIEGPTWTHQDTQVHLSAIATIPSPMNRCFTQVLNWPIVTVSTDATHSLSFQRGFIPLFLYLSCNAVINSPIKHYTLALYAVLDVNVPQWAGKTLRCIRELVNQKHLVERSATVARTFKTASFLQVFLPFTYVLCGYLASFQKALSKHGNVLSELVEALPALFDDWAADMASESPTYRDVITSQDLATRQSIVSEAEKAIHRLRQIVDRCQGRVTQRPTQIVRAIDEKKKQQWQLDRLQEIYAPAGSLHPAGPRHDNDHTDIRSIQSLPTHVELICNVPPFLPANSPSAPHHFEPGTMDRQLDVLFRLLRENTFGPFQTAIKHLVYNLRGHRTHALSNFLQRGGGRWRAEGSSSAIDLNIYSSARFEALELVRDDLCVVLSLKTPKGAGSRSEIRKKLGSGTMVGLLMSKPGARGADKLKVFLGDIKEDVKWRPGGSDEVFAAATKFFRSAKSQGEDDQDSMVFFEVPGFLLGTLMPFLERLQSVEPTTIPLGQYIAGTTDASMPAPDIASPRFTRNPSFVYNLDRLVNKGEGLRMRPSDPNQVHEAKEALLEHSPLDDTQTSALMDAMSRELAIIEGPPGTGKSYIGVKHVQVLVDSGITPIYVIAHTNHALDQFLEDIYNQVTTSVVRCGSRSKSELMQTRSLYELSQSAPAPFRSALRQEMGREYAFRREVEKELEDVCNIASSAGKSKLPWDILEMYLRREYPDHYRVLSQSPQAIIDGYHLELEEGWNTQGQEKFQPPFVSPYIWWREGLDLELLDRLKSGPAEMPAKEEEVEVLPFDLSDIPAYLQEMLDVEDAEDAASEASTMLDEITLAQALRASSGSWQRPSSDRDIEDLLDDPDVWDFSPVERRRILAYWKEDILDSEIPKLARLRKAYSDINARIRSLKNEKKLEVLRDAKIIGCTTNGAANISSLIASTSPRVLILILIGDHLQLRPQVSNYRLSMESREGKIYRLDESLFERLVNAGLPYSVLQTQRRMRPEISDLIRNHLYPDLVDHESVQIQPALKGMSRNVVFFDHSHAQDRPMADSASKTNTFEAEMVCDLVAHFINQGYKAGDIAVLTPYLGQVKLIKTVLEKKTLVVELDDRDERDMVRLALVDEGHQEDAGGLSNKTFEHRSADSLVTLRSVDNFQGEEAKVVILSLVRNGGSGMPEETDRPVTFDRSAIASIGFLKSANRANAALSRAKEGMVILGNADLFASQSAMWKSVISTLEEQDAVFDYVPLRCDLHPDHDFGKIQTPGLIPIRSPEGGCLAPCDSKLACGHPCPRLCHPADRGCTAAQSSSSLTCKEMMEQVLPCGHTVRILCGEETSDITCTQVCGMQLDCKHSSCKAACGNCRPPSFFSQVPAPILQHGDHRCDRQLPCGHSCTGVCQKDLETGCAPCKAICQLRCDHASCEHECGQGSCRSCLEGCTWSCVHQGACQNLCSMPCSRLPCDEPCDRLLSCGHPCPSVCGEDCSKQICPRCATEDQKSSVVDLINMTALADIDTSKSGLDNRLITLTCGHTFTLETLDAQMGLNDLYLQHNDVWIGLANPRSTTGKQESLNKSCSHCRAPVLSTATRRYGRPLKHYDLQRQERATINEGSTRLARLAAGQAAIDTASIIASVETTSMATLSSPLKKLPVKRVVLQQERDLTDKILLTPWTCIVDLSTVGIVGSVLKSWKATVAPLQPLYQLARSIAEHKSSHIKAYEATHAKLYRSSKAQLMAQAMDQEPQDLRASTVTEMALDHARQQIGSPCPRASSTFKIKAVWVTLDLRLDFLSVCKAFATKLSEGPLTGDRRATINRFDIFVRYFIRCGLRDASACIEHSRDNQAPNQIIQSWIYRLRFQLALSRLDVELAQCRHTSEKPYKADQTAERVKAERQAAFEAIDEAVSRYRNPPRAIEEEWSNVVNMAEKGAKVPELSLAEKREIFRAMSADAPANGAATRWMSCPNGHPYAVGDCGQANQGGNCPECGAVIGGRGFHGSAFADGNSLSTAFDNMSVA